MSYFENTCPEALNIRPEGILSFLDAVKKKGLELHSLKVIRHGKCCASTWFAPYGPDDLHPIYSFSKSFTAAAIGFAWQEGLLTLDEKIIDIFPESCPEVISENLSEITIHHLLSMSCGHETLMNSYDRSAYGGTDEAVDWIRDFLAHPVPHKPGTFYLYNTPGTNMLSAIITRKTGQTLLEYLRPRLLDPLGIDDITCHIIPGEPKVCHGGGGMKLTTEGMARFAYFMLHKGQWEGRKLLSGWYEMAGVKQMETLGDSEGHIKEWGNGYGYQCWIGSLPDSFRADGAFGQFGFVFPSLDLIVIMTSATEQTQTLVDCMYEKLLPAVLKEDSTCQEEITEKDSIFNLEEILNSQHIEGLLACRNPEVEQRLEGLTYQSEEAMKDASTMSSFEKLVGGAGLFDLSDDTAITSMAFHFLENEVVWTMNDGGMEKEIHASLAGSFTKNVIKDRTYAASARWRALYALEMEIRRVDAISGVRLIFRFQENQLTIEADETLMTFGGLGMNEKHLVPFNAVSQ